jgi:hypothetical protein
MNLIPPKSNSTEDKQQVHHSLNELHDCAGITVETPQLPFENWRNSNGEHD